MDTNDFAKSFLQTLNSPAFQYMKTSLVSFTITCSKIVYNFTFKTPIANGLWRVDYKKPKVSHSNLSSPLIVIS
ncbi:Uncharacterized protein HZ326_21147 [Fusarium oxysporum f. sp. albedinis]|nr:Uncharacterized protein HZ326_21147 [Fusarium oxysporum f. sp. albedinis]